MITKNLNLSVDYLIAYCSTSKLLVCRICERIQNDMVNSSPGLTVKVAIKLFKKKIKSKLKMN